MMNYDYSIPHYVMAKPVSQRCNLECQYCYYLLSGEQRRQCSTAKMSDEVLQTYIRSYIESSVDSEVVFCWHGGEPLLASRSFYERVVSLQQRFAAGRTIVNTIQTNGTLITPDWCSFFADNHFLVGISVDGPQHLHDAYRHYSNGRSSFMDVMRAIELMQRYRVEYNILSVINNRTAQSPLEVYRFLRSLGTPFLQFSPNVERRNGQLTPSSVSPLDFGRFYCAVFDEWFRQDIGRVFVQMFDATLACLMHQPTPVCLFGQQCGHATVLEANGDIYCCDHFAIEDYRLGNLNDQSLPSILQSDKLLKFGLQKAVLHSDCRTCPYLNLCYGECPKNRFPLSADEQPPYKNYLCPGYQMYFAHTLPTFEHIRRQILANNKV